MNLTRYYRKHTIVPSNMVVVELLCCLLRHDDFVVSEALNSAFYQKILKEDLSFKGKLSKVHQEVLLKPKFWNGLAKVRA